MEGGTAAIQFFEKTLNLAASPNRGNELIAILLEQYIVQPAQVKLHTITENSLAPTMQPTNSTDALATMPVEDFQDFLLVGWSVGRRRLKHTVAAEVLAVHVKRPPEIEYLSARIYL
ncbi:MAG: hypothetical protein QF440_04620 [Candidatus Thalassarchaeaceae archaeon]|nr:hypothetical protein [Candidatus Thalassarchaeaceae archaeon]